MKLTAKQAYALLIEGLEAPETIGYVTHSRFVGDLAGMIAAELGLDAAYATVLGYLHDIGRRIDPGNHIYAGYRFLKEHGYGEYAFICLTHSFLNNDIECICGRQLSPESEGYAEVKAFVESHENTDYDRIVQTCDLLCLHTGGTTLEARIDDIESRKGTHAKSQAHRAAAIAQKADIERRLGHSIYAFYPRLSGTRYPGLKLIKLTKAYEKQLGEMIDEWKADQEKNHTNRSPGAIFKNDYHDFDFYLEHLELKTPTDGKVPGSVFFLLDEERDRLLGAVNIRHYLNDFLYREGGHIGDGIRPSERRKGYATKMIGLALKECRKLGIRHVLMVCDKDNIGSAKSIINNGGVLENEFVNDQDVIEQRYWITLDDAGCSLCGADCAACPLKTTCRGCAATCGRPFGGTCVAAETIKRSGKQAYAAFKEKLLAECNALLAANGLGQAKTLYELSGAFVNLALPLPSGEAVRFLNDNNVYLGAQIEQEGTNRCIGVLADAKFILLCSYGANAADPRLIAYQRRNG